MLAMLLRAPGSAKLLAVSKKLSPIQAFQLALLPDCKGMAAFYIEFASSKFNRIWRSYSRRSPVDSGVMDRTRGV